MTGDMSAIHRVIRQAIQPELAQDYVASRIGYMANGQGLTSSFHRFLLIPIVVESAVNESVANSIWAASGSTLRDELIRWFPKDMRLVVYGGVTPLHWVTAWDGHIIRSHLKRLLPGQVDIQVDFIPHVIALPQSAPRLFFIAMSISKKHQQPCLPHQERALDWRVKDVTQKLFQLSRKAAGMDAAGAPIALLPSDFGNAVVDGVMAWLNLLHQQEPLRGFRISQKSYDIDIVCIDLEYQNRQLPVTSFVLRTQLIGATGISKVIAMLASTCASLEESHVYC